MSAPKYLSHAARQAAYRVRSGAKSLSVLIPNDLSNQLDEYLRFRLESKSDVIVKLLRQQLLRKR
jgi:metal-responsive CopG/Arc/MetJ family transcriptional regulator